MNLDYVKKVFGLEGKNAVVTGGNSGIGRAAAVSLASMGADVSIIGRDRQTLDETVAELKGINPACAGSCVDISNKSEVEEYFNAYRRDNAGRIDILVANAGVCKTLHAMDTTEEDIDYFFNINYKGTLYCCQQAAAAMKKQMSGNIIIVSSVNALYPYPKEAAYSSSKGAQEVLMRCLAVDLAPFNIRVNSVAPGAILTKIMRHEEFFDMDFDFDKAWPELPLGRIGEPEDIGEAIACLASDAFRYMTGATILIDGGLMLRNV